MKQRTTKPNERATYQAFIDKRRGTGAIKDLPIGRGVSCRGRNWTVAGYDDTLGVTTLRLVNRDCSVELSLVPPDEVIKAVGPR